MNILFQPDKARNPLLPEIGEASVFTLSETGLDQKFITGKAGSLYFPKPPVAAIAGADIASGGKGGLWGAGIQERMFIRADAYFWWPYASSSPCADVTLFSFQPARGPPDIKKPPRCGGGWR